MSILFISRAYPPVVGGIEKQNYDVFQHLARRMDVHLIANTRGKAFLPLFFLQVLYRSFKLRKSTKVILLGDGLLAPIGYLLKLTSARPVLCILHGLDITYARAWYQYFWIRCFLPRLDRYIAVSHETIRRGREAGLPIDAFVCIPNGVSIDTRIQESSAKDALGFLGALPEGPVLLTLGRLVKRKGVAWFIEKVVPRLDPAVTYLVAGGGPEEAEIKQLIERLGLHDRVKCLGVVGEREKHALLKIADVFIQPNVPVEGDMEGFGLVVLEAGLNETWVLASRLEGLVDAIREGKNGQLIEPLDEDAWVKHIEDCLGDRPRLERKSKEAAVFVKGVFSWDVLMESYEALLKQYVETPT